MTRQFIIDLYVIPSVYDKKSKKWKQDNNKSKKTILQVRNHAHLKQILKRMGLNLNNFYNISPSDTYKEFKRLEQNGWVTYLLVVHSYQYIPQQRLSYDIQRLLNKENITIIESASLKME